MVMFGRSNSRPGPDERLRRLEAVTDADLSRLDNDELLAALLDRTRELLRADTAGILLLEPSGEEFVATAARGSGARTGVRIPVGDTFADSVIRKCQPVRMQEGDWPDGVLPAGTTSAIGVPMITSGRPVGVLHVEVQAGRRFTADDEELLRLVADRIALVTDARAARLDRDTTLALQRSLLPAQPQGMPGLEVAARYVPGASVGVGGDWYDLF